MARSCNTCDFWHRGRSDERPECRAMAPQLLVEADGKHSRAWPVAFPLDWCGMWVERQSAAPTYEVDALIVEKIASGALSEKFTARDVYSRGWSGLTNGASVELALRQMVDAGILTEVQAKTGGRPTTQYLVMKGRD